MTDHRDIEREGLDREQQALSLALEQATAIGRDGYAPAVDEPQDGELVREYTELLGLLAYELEPETPRAEVKERLLAALGGPGIDQAEREREGRHGRPPLIFPGNPAPASPSGASWATPRGPVYALAAALVLCLLGVGFLSGTALSQRSTIDRLAGDLRASSQMIPQVLGLEEKLRTYENRVEMLTTVARQVYPMRQVADTRSARTPDGVVYVCGEHQRWYFNARGLAPPPEGMEYHLWFMTADGAIDGGVLQVEEDRPVEMEALSMPAGTRGFAVTLEQRSQPHEEPGTIVLLGEQHVSL